MAESMFGEFDGLKVGAYPDNAEVIRERTLEAFHANFPGSEITMRRRGEEQEAYGYTFVYKQIVEVDDLTLTHGGAIVDPRFWSNFLKGNGELFRRAVCSEATDVDKENVWRKIIESLVGLDAEILGRKTPGDSNAAFNLSPVALSVPRFEDAEQLAQWRPFLDLYGFRVLESEFEPPHAVPDLSNPKLFDQLFVTRNPVSNFWHVLSSRIRSHEGKVGANSLHLNPVSSGVPTSHEIKTATVVGTTNLDIARQRIISQEGYRAVEKEVRDERDRSYRYEEQVRQDRRRRGYYAPSTEDDSSTPGENDGRILGGEGYSFSAGTIGGP